MLLACPQACILHRGWLGFFILAFVVLVAIVLLVVYYCLKRSDQVVQKKHDQDIDQLLDQVPCAHACIHT